MTAREGRALLLIGTLGAAALVWLLPRAARWPAYLSADTLQTMFERGGIAKPYQWVVLVSPVAVGIVVVALCAALYFWWISRPLVLRPPRRRKRSPRS